MNKEFHQKNCQLQNASQNSRNRPMIPLAFKMTYKCFNISLIFNLALSVKSSQPLSYLLTLMQSCTSYSTEKELVDSASLRQSNLPTLQMIRKAAKLNLSANTTSKWDQTINAQIVPLQTF